MVWISKMPNGTATQTCCRLLQDKTQRHTWVCHKTPPSAPRLEQGFEVRLVAAVNDAGDFEIPNTLVYVPSYDQKLSLRSLPSLEFDENVVYNSKKGGMKIVRPTVHEEEVLSPEIIISNLHIASSFTFKSLILRQISFSLMLKGLIVVYLQP